MNKFPNKNYANISDYSKEYFDLKYSLTEKLNFEVLQLISDSITECYNNNNFVFSCGNGGSASISNHLVCDHIKGIQSDTTLKPKVISLSNNIELITAISNDISYEEIFSYQLNSLGSSNDILIVISSSGNSKNVINAIKTAKSIKMKVISLTGFDGGLVKKHSDINLNIDCFNYGIVEDMHQSIMHILAQYIRNSLMNDKQIKDKLF